MVQDKVGNHLYGKVHFNAFFAITPSKKVNPITYTK